jgi:hypothetical protein
MKIHKSIKESASTRQANKNIVSTADIIFMVYNEETLA